MAERDDGRRPEQEDRASGAVELGRSDPDDGVYASGRAHAARAGGTSREDRRERAADTGDRHDHQPGTPTELPKRRWWQTIKRTVKEFQDDNLTDWAAALTYYGVLSIFPGLLVVLSLVGLAGEDATRTVVDNINQVTPPPARDVLQPAIDSLSNQRSAGFFAIVGVTVALWSASGYIAAFMRASNAIYDIPEGRPIWKTMPIRVGVTALMVVLLVITVAAVVLTGGIAEQVGEWIGVGSTAVAVWDVAKWPVLLVIVSFMFAVLYWACPNVKHPGFRWITPGGVLAVLVWVAASAGFAFYVANFGSYNKTYGAIASVIVFLVWLWLSNTALLLGAEFDAELERERHIAAGYPPDQEPYVEPRDTRKLPDDFDVSPARAGQDDRDGRRD
jgi:membrane protein